MKLKSSPPMVGSTSSWNGANFAEMLATCIEQSYLCGHGRCDVQHASPTSACIRCWVLAGGTTMPTASRSICSRCMLDRTRVGVDSEHHGLHGAVVNGRRVGQLLPGEVGAAAVRLRRQRRHLHAAPAMAGYGFRQFLTLERRNASLLHRAKLVLIDSENVAVEAIFVKCFCKGTSWVNESPAEAATGQGTRGGDHLRDTRTQLPKRLLVSALMVPDSCTRSGITFDAPGPAPRVALSCTPYRVAWLRRNTLHAAHMAGLGSATMPSDEFRIAFHMCLQTSVPSAQGAAEKTPEQCTVAATYLC